MKSHIPHHISSSIHITYRFRNFIPKYHFFSILNLCLLFITCITLLSPSLSHAEIDPNITIQDEQKYTIAFLQQSIPIYLYKDVPLNVSIDVVQLRKDILSQAQNHPYLTMLSDHDIAKSMQLDEISQNNDFIQTEIDMGYAENLMANLNYLPATTLLLRIVQNFKQTMQGYFNPKIVARAWQMLAYAYIAQLDTSPDLRISARLAFLEFIRLAPHIMMLQGRQPQIRVEIYDEALDLFLSSPINRQTPQRDADAIAQQIHADILVFFRIIQDKSGSLLLEIDSYQKANRQISYAQIPLQTKDITDPEALSEYMQDVTSQFLADIYDNLIPKDTSPVISNIFAHKLAVATGPSYSLFITHPTSNLLHGVGAFLDLSYHINRFVFLKGQFEINAFLPDNSHELYNVFRIYRIPIYIGLTKDWKFVAIHLAIGSMFSFSSNYTITKSITCKTFGLYDLECNPNDVTINRDPFSFSIPFLFSANIGKDPFSILFETYLAATVYPIEERVFRHSFGLRLGIQYHFY